MKMPIDASKLQQARHCVVSAAALLKAFKHHEDLDEVLTILETVIDEIDAELVRTGRDADVQS